MIAPLVILLAEDCEFIAEPLELRFKLLGHSVVSVRDGLSALAAAAQCKPDLAIVDLRLPQLDGLSVVRRLKADRDFSIAPIITMSAGNWNLDQPAALAAGAEHHLQKPFRFADLMALVERLRASERCCGAAR